MKQLKKYSDKQFKILTGLLGVYELTIEQDTLHKIRVQLKKIRAVFHLINYCSKNFNVSKEYRSLKKIFSAAGRIRETDVADKLFSEYDIRNINSESKTEKKNKLISEFRGNISRYKKTVAKKKTEIQKFFENVNRSCLTRYVNSKKAELQKQTYPLLIESDLHKSRKIIKEIIYLSGISNWRKKNLDSSYDEIQDAIGKWHDKRMLLDLINENDLDHKGNTSKKINLRSLSDVKAVEKLIKNFYDGDGSGKMIIYKNAN